MSRAESYFTLPPDELQKSNEPFIFDTVIKSYDFQNSFKAFLSVNLPGIKESVSSNTEFPLFGSDRPTPEMVVQLFKEVAEKTWMRFKRDRKYSQDARCFLSDTAEKINAKFKTDVKLEFD